MNEKYMELAISMAKKAFKKGEIPVGAVIVKNGKIIAKSYNTKEKNKDVTCHAEINAIKKACKKLKTWHLEDCELYTTLEPCMMCTGAIIQSRIKKIYFSTTNESFGELVNYVNNNKIKLQINEGLYKDESIKLLQKFFKNKRK